MDSGIVKYAPVFWFHSKEKFLSIDVKALVEISELYRDNKKVSFSGNIDDLDDLEDQGKDY